MALFPTLVIRRSKPCYYSWVTYQNNL